MTPCRQQHYFSPFDFFLTFEDFCRGLVPWVPQVTGYSKKI
jgi:hypothetical protein